MGSSTEGEHTPRGHATRIHQFVAEARAGENPRVICRVGSGWVILGDTQFLRGYSLLLPDPVVPDLNALSAGAREQFLADMTRLGDALLEITGAVRMNYEILGNLEPALHAHVFPRYADEPDGYRTGPPFLYPSEVRDGTPFDLARDAPLMQRIAEAIGRPSPSSDPGRSSPGMDGAAWLDSTRRELRQLRSLAERALEQVSDAQFAATLDPSSNSLAMLVKHMAGNLRSRWTDFLTSDGEKPDRRRDAEFEIGAEDTRESLMARWTAGWQALATAIDPLTPVDLSRIVLIRGEPHTVVAALQRQVAHYGQHVGQIVLLSKHFAGPGWHTLSVPRGQSESFNRQMKARFGSDSRP